MPWGLIAIGAGALALFGGGVATGVAVSKNMLTTAALVAGGVWLWQRSR